MSLVTTGSHDVEHFAQQGPLVGIHRQIHAIVAPWQLGDERQHQPRRQLRGDGLCPGYRPCVADPRQTVVFVNTLTICDTVCMPSIQLVRITRSGKLTPLSLRLETGATLILLLQCPRVLKVIAPPTRMNERNTVAGHTRQCCVTHVSM